MIQVPAGSFRMGSPPDLGVPDEHPQHSVNLDTFWIDQTEVSNAMYAQCEKAGACSPPSSPASATRPNYYDNPQYSAFPVVFISWEAAGSYCTWAGARLPTEAEWEKAARGAQGNTYPWGNALPDINRLNYQRNIGDTTEVGHYPSGASPYGAFDMLGNVWEWVSDWYGATYYSDSLENNPSGPPDGIHKIVKGASWNTTESLTRAATRGEAEPKFTGSEIGFRCAQSP
jgi:formylglycine-generating enzyme required for sulfatase activity